MANCPERDVRRHWVQRIIDHDGLAGDEGGIEAWIRLGEAVGLKREDVTSLKLVLPGVRFSVDAYVNFARQSSWQEAACSSLTELFAPEIHQKRLDTWPEYYPWIDAEGYYYFRKRLTEARRDVQHGLQITLDHFKTRAQQERALEILQFKLNILWTMLDVMHVAYVDEMPPFFNIKAHD
jgi:pyrroloquinoline-quinone synthase